MRRIILWASVAILLQTMSFVAWSQESQRQPMKSDTASQYLGKATNNKWEIAIQSVTADTTELDVYIDTASVDSKTPRTLKSTDLVGTILGKMTPNQDMYVISIKVGIKNKLNKELRFYLHDLSLKIGKDLLRPGAYSTDKMALPVMTIHNVEFKVSPYAKENYSFLFGIPYKAAMFFLLFQDLEPIKTLRPALPIEHEKMQ